MEAYKIYLAVCFGLTLTTFFISLGFGERGRDRLEREWEEKANTGKTEYSLRGMLAWLQPLVPI